MKLNMRPYFQTLYRLPTRIIPFGLTCVCFALLLAGGVHALPVAQADSGTPATSGAGKPPAAPPKLEAVAHPNLDQFEIGVAEKIASAQEALLKAAQAGDAPRYSQAFSQLGMLYHHLELREAARAAYRNAIRLHPYNLEATYLAGYVALEMDELDEAAKLFELALGLKTNYPPALLRLGNVRRKQGRFDHAEKLYDLVLALLPDSAAALAGKAELAREKKDCATAVSLLEKAIKLDPGADQLNYPLALCLRQLGELDRAREHMAKRGLRRPGIADPMLGRVEHAMRSSQTDIGEGYLAYQAGEYKTAAAAYRKALESNPADHTTRVALGWVLEILGESESAFTELRKVIKAEPEHAKAHYSMGALYEHLGRDEKALPHYRKAVAAQPDALPPRLLLANALMRTGKYKQAGEQYAELSKRNPKDWRGLYYQGLARVATGQCEPAMQSLNQAMQINPRQAEVAEALARATATCESAGDSHKQAVLRLAKQLYHALPDMLHAETLAMAHAAMGEFKDAVDYQTQTIFEALKLGVGAERPWLQENLRRYRDGKPARTAWPAGDRVFSPPRVTTQERLRAEQQARETQSPPAKTAEKTSPAQN